MNKILLLRLSIWICCLLSLQACVTDDFSNHTNNSDILFQNRKFSVLTQKQVENIDGLIEKVQNIEKTIVTENRADRFSKVNQDSLLHGSIIEKDSVLLIEHNGSKTYTFKISRSSGSSGVENLVLKKNADYTFSGVLMKYDLTDAEKQIAGLGHSLDLTNKIQVFPIENLDIQAKVVSQTSGCYTITWETGICAAGLHTYGQPCNLTGDDRAGISQIISVHNKCSGTAVSDIGVDTDDNPSGGGGWDTGVWGAGGEGSAFNPCDQLKKIQNESEFKNRMGILKGNIDTGTKEKGFVLYSEPVPNSNYLPPKFKISNIIEGGDNGTIDYKTYFSNLSSMDLLYRSYGAGHNHLKNNPDHIGVFTPEDLANLLFFGWLETDTNNPYGTMNAENSINFVITKIGLFAVKINDLSKLEAFMVKYGSIGLNPEKKENYFENIIQAKYNLLSNSTNNEQITGFLRLIEDEKMGIDFYESKLYQF